MIESFLLLIFFIIGGIASLFAVFFFVIALIRRSKTMFYLGLGISVVPLFLYGLTFWYYNIHMSGQYQQEQTNYLGTYVLQSPHSNEELTLILYSNNAFEIDRIKGFTFSGKGFWKAGQTEEGQLTFYNSQNSIVFWAWPYDNNRIEIEENSIQFIFIKIEQ